MLMLIPFLVVIPIGLIVTGGLLVQKRGNPDTVGQRYFLFLTWTAIGLLTPVVINWTFPRLNIGIGTLFIPIIPALIVMILLHAGARRDLSGKQRAPIYVGIILLLVLGVARFWLSDSADDQYLLEVVLEGTMLLSISVFVFIVWKWGNRFPLLFAIIAILYLALFNWFELGALSIPDDASLDSLIRLGISALAYLVIPGYVIAVIAMFGLNVPKPVTGSNGQSIGLCFIAIFLWGFVFYTYTWLGIWDGADDGVRWILILFATMASVTSIGVVIGMTVSGWRRWLGLPFAIVIIAVLYGGVLLLLNGFSDYSAMTEDRAWHIQQGIERFHAKTGWYPLSLDELTPSEMLRIPLPLIVPGQNWCYQGGSNYYRLGLVYREHWSSPYFSVRVYASAGDIPDGGWECDERLAEVNAQYQADLNKPPASSPLPESSISIQRIYMEPILSGTSFSVGDWSPDGRYLVFGKTEYFMNEVEQVKIDLQFIDSTTGSICQPPESVWIVQESDGLQGHYAWLPDGRFLYVTNDGEMWTFKPCTTDIENLSSRFSYAFIGVASFDENSNNVLLKDEGGYWLLNGSSLEVRKIADIPVESYRDFYSWSADGKRLAISILTASEEGEPAFLYVVNTESGEVEYEMPLQDVSDANLPIVEWLTPNDLLLHSKTLTVMDFHTNPPTTTDLLHDVFLLDIEYPIDISSMDSYLGVDGYTVGIRVNLPHNKNVYMYESKTGQVTVYEHDTHSLFFFPDGRWMRLFEWEDVPSYKDEYEMVWMDHPDVSRSLTVEGHVPRDHPQLFPHYLPQSSQLVFNSSQGISLVSIPDGKTIRFWSLRGAEDAYSRVSPSPQENALIVFVEGVGLYYIPLISN